MDVRNRTTTRRITDALLVAVLLAGTGLPFAGSFFMWNTRDVTDENRALVGFPIIERTRASVETWPKRFEDYFNDRFGFRNSLMAMQHAARFRLLGQQSNDKAIVGKQGWLFYSAGKILDDWRGVHPISESNLRLFQRILEQRRDRLKSKGIRYIFVLVPEKSTVYPEFLPDDVRRGDLPSRLDQVVDYLASHSTLEVVDTRPGLLRAKRRVRVFHKTDTHWNDEGAFAAYRQIAGQLARGDSRVRPLPRSEFNVRVSEDHSPGDLARMLGVQDLLTEDRIILERRGPSPTHPGPLGALLEARPWTPTCGPVVRVRDDGLGGKAVVIRDSFMDAVIPFLSDHFRRVVYLLQEFDTDVILDEQPDVVIEEWAERRLSGL